MGSVEPTSGNKYSPVTLLFCKHFSKAITLNVDYGVVQCALGWVNFSEFEITMCGMLQNVKKLNGLFFLFFKKNFVLRKS